MARIALGSNVKEGPRRGQVVGHRPKGMVDVQFEDVGWVERRQEQSLRKGNPAGKGDTYDPTLEQWRRQVLGIYKTQVKRGFTPEQAKKDAFRIAGGVTYRDGRRKKGKMEATAKGRRGAKAKLESPDAWKKRQEWELFLAIGRKSGKHRVVPQKHGKQTRYSVQPGGRYFYGTGAKKRAMALRDELNGVKMRGRKRKAANPGDYYDHSEVSSKRRAMYPDTDAPYLVMADRDKVFEYKRFRDAKKKAGELAKTASEVMVFQEGQLVLQYRNNWVPVALGVTASVATLADLAQRKWKEKQKKAKNPRYLDERGGMARGSFGLHAAARDQLQQARILGQLKGLRELAYDRIQGTKQKHREARVEAQRDLDKVEIEFTTLVRQVTNEIPSRESGLRSQAQSKAMGALRTEYSTAYHKVLDDQAAKRRRRRKVLNPVKSKMRGIAKSGVPYHWGGVRTPKSYQGMKPTLFREGKTFYLVYEGRSRKIPRVISDANRAAGLKGAKWKREKSVTSALWKDVDETPTRYSIQHPESGRGSKSDPYRIYDKEKGRFFKKTFTRKKDADDFLWEKQGGTRRDYSTKARGLEDRPRDEQVRSDRFAGAQITAYTTTSLSRAEYVAKHLDFIEIPFGTFEKIEVGEEPYRREKVGPYKVYGIGTRPEQRRRRRFFPLTYTMVTPLGAAFLNKKFASPAEAVKAALRVKTREGGPTVRQGLKALDKRMPDYERLSAAEARQRMVLDRLTLYGYTISDFTVTGAPSTVSGDFQLSPVTLTDRFRNDDGTVRTSKRKAWNLTQEKDGGHVTLGTGTKAQMEKLRRQKVKSGSIASPKAAIKKAQAEIDSAMRAVEVAESKITTTPSRPSFTLLAHGRGGDIQFTEEGFDLTGPVGVVKINLNALSDPTVEQIWKSGPTARKRKGSLGHPELDWLGAIRAKQTRLSPRQASRIERQREERAESQLMAHGGRAPIVKAPSKRRALVSQFQYKQSKRKGEKVYSTKTERMDPFDRKLAELEALEAQLAALKAKANPMRTNSFAAVGRGALAGGKWLVQSKTGRAILSEAAVIGTMIVGEKLMSQGKVSPKVMKYIQARVEKETGQKPSQAEVRKVLKGIDPNQDQTLTADEVTRVLRKGRRKR